MNIKIATCIRNVEVFLVRARHAFVLLVVAFDVAHCAIHRGEHGQLLGALVACEGAMRLLLALSRVEGYLWQLCL